MADSFDIGTPKGRELSITALAKVRFPQSVSGVLAMAAGNLTILELAKQSEGGLDAARRRIMDMPLEKLEQ